MRAATVWLPLGGSSGVPSTSTVGSAASVTPTGGNMEDSSSLPSGVGCQIGMFTCIETTKILCGQLNARCTTCQCFD